ncbi:MAG: hypothetical protein J7621_26755, partial [Niastella sp.]|nr:hypothetical protein [Niastella sp.]
MKPSSRCIMVLCISTLLILPKKVARACGFYIWPGEYRFWLLQPDLSNQPGLSPYYFSTLAFFPDDQPESAPPHYRQNVQEWIALIGGKTNEQDVDAIIYDTPPNDFLTNLDQLSKTNSFARLLKQPGNKELLNYMKLAKKIELYTANPDPWQENKYSDPNRDKLISEAEARYKSSTNPNLRMRLAYQLVRLYGYDYSYNTAAKWQQKVADEKIDSWIQYAALYDRARSAPEPEKYYLMSRVFDQSNFNRKYCLWGFREVNLKKVLPFTTSEHERTVLYAMKAFRDPGRTLHNIKYIYSREPHYKEIPFLLLREINKAEDWLLTNKVTGFEPATAESWYAEADGDNVKNYKMDQLYARQLYDFVKQLLAERKQQDRPLLQLCAAHLAFIQGMPSVSRQHLEAASRMSNLPAKIKTQIQINDLLLRLEADSSFDKTTEDKLMRLLLAPASQLDVHSPGYMKDQLILYTGKKLIRNGQRAKGLLLLGKTRRALGLLSIDTYKSVYEMMWETATANDYNEMLHLLQKQSKSPFERFVTQGTVATPYDYYDWAKDDPKAKWNINKLMDLKAGWYIRQDSLEKALAVLKQIPDTFWLKYPYDEYVKGNPFYLNINHPRKREKGEEDYDKIQVVAGMIRLKQKAVEDKKNAALHYYKLANAYYNLTWHGKLWILSKPWSSMYDISDYSKDLTVSRFNDAYYGCIRARAY